IDWFGQIFLVIIVIISPELKYGCIDRCPGNGLGKGHIKPLFCQIHRINIKRRTSGIPYPLDAMVTSPTVFGLSDPQTPIGTKSHPVVAHPQSLVVDKWYTGALEFSVNFFKHDPDDPIPIHLPDEHLTGERPKFSTGEIPQRFRWGIGHDALWKKHSGDRPHLVQCLYRLIKRISIRPVLFPYQTRRMTVKMILADVVQRTRRYPITLVVRHK